MPYEKTKDKIPTSESSSEIESMKFVCDGDCILVDVESDVVCFFIVLSSFLVHAIAAKYAALFLPD